MVNKSLRTISDGVRFSYSASLEVRVVPLGVLITSTCGVATGFTFKALLMVQNYRVNIQSQIVERRLFSQQLVTPYIKNINAIFRRNSKLMVALSFSVYFTATRFIAGIKCRKINAGPFRT